MPEDASKGQQSKQPFVSQTDRPEVRINPDTRVSELTVRDLATILSGSRAKSVEKNPLKELKEHKELKVEKFEKHEHKEFKIEKLEIDAIFNPGPYEPGIGGVIEAVGALTKVVETLRNEVEELKRRSGT